MSIFRRENETRSQPPTQAAALPPQSPSPTRPAPNTPAASTHVAAGCKVVGQISGAAELIVDGHVDGKIVLDSRVRIGIDGRVDGEIEAQSIEVAGKVFGNVHGLDKVEVLADGSLQGDVVSPKVVIAEGAFFKGNVEMTGKSPQKKGGPAPVTKPKSGPRPAPVQQAGGGKGRP